MPNNNTNSLNELNKSVLNAILGDTNVQRPFMLFPLRLETHFRKVKNQKQLCVRVIPDEIMLDYHTDSLTKQEIEDGKFFWIQWYIASGSDVREYEAWEVLCKKYPVYRAAWICRCLRPEYIDEYRPFNEKTNDVGRFFYRRPYKELADIETKCQIIYSDLSELSLCLSEKDVEQTEEETEIERKVRVNLDQVQQYLFGIQSSVSRCKYIVDYLYDTIYNMAEYLSRSLENCNNFYEKFPGRYKDNCRRLELWDVDYAILSSLRKDVDAFIKTLSSKRITLDDMVNSYLADDSIFSGDTLLRKNKWTINEDRKLEVPKSNILPKRFFFIGEVDNSNKDKIYAFSNEIPSDLQMGIDPNEQEVDENGLKVSPYQIDSNGDMVIKGGAKWMMDYDEAEKCGMAITVPIPESVKRFTYIYVLGVNNYSEKESTNRLADLFNGHNYAVSSMSFLSAGTPTNSLDGNFKDDSEEIKRERFDIEVNDSYKKFSKSKDSRILADFTGMEFDDCWGSVVGGNHTQSEMAQVVYRELWNHFRNNIKNEDDDLKEILDLVGDFVVNHVRARGVLPTIKIDTLPYGFLPVADYEKLRESFNDGSEESKKFIRLFDQLVELANTWKECRKDQKLWSKELVGDKAEQNYLKMAGQTPYSISFVERSVLRTPFLEKNFLKYPAAGILAELSDREFFADQPIDDATKEVSLQNLKNCINWNIRNQLSDEELNIYVAEFLDLFTYRLDAWFTGFVKYAKERMDKGGVGAAPQIGAYGWVFNLEENAREEIIGSQKKNIVKEMSLSSQIDAPIYKVRGDDKGHYVVAPSIQHALTTAVLRSAYLKSKNGADDAHICVNLSSMRVRQALRLVDGVKHGMSTSVILGVDLERYLHDASDVFGPALDQFIYPLRQQFKQVVDLNSQTEEAGNYSMQVINGEALLNTFIKEWNWSKSVSSWLEENCQDTEYACLEWLRTLNEDSNYSLFAKQKKETEENITAKGHVFFKQIERLMDSYDALNDLLLSESVHRLVMGDKSSFYAINQFLEDGKGSIPELEVLKIPSEHVVVAHKAGIMLPEVAIDVDDEDNTNNLFDLADPSVNAWVESVVGDMDKIKFFVKKLSDKDINEVETCSLAQLGISGSEYIYLSSYEGVFKNYLKTKWHLLNPEFIEEIEILEEPEDDCVLEEGELCLEEDRIRLKELRGIVLHSREMRAPDIQSSLWEGADETAYTDMKELKFRYDNLLLREGVLHSKISKWCKKAEKLDLYDDAFVRDAYMYLCNCVEVGLVNCIGKFDTNIFADNIDDIVYPEKRQDAQTLQKELFETMRTVESQLVERMDKAKSLVDSKDGLAVSDYISAIQSLTLEKIRVVPRFRIIKGGVIDVSIAERAMRIDNAVKGRQNSKCDGFIYSNLNQGSFDQWEDEVSEVREGMRRLHQLSMFQTAIDMDLGKVAVLQAESSKSEIIAGNWLGLAVDEESELQDVDSIVLYNADAYNRQCVRGGLSLATNAGLIVDSWVEYIPYIKHNAGLVFHNDRPDNEAPQAVLVAINHNVNAGSGYVQTEEIPNEIPNVVDHANVTYRRLCWCPACRKESLRYRNNVLNKNNNANKVSKKLSSNKHGYEKKWDIDSLLGILDETRFMMMNRVVDPDTVYTNKKLSPIFPLLSEIIFENLKNMSYITGSTSGIYQNKLMLWNVFDAISGGKNIRG